MQLTRMGHKIVCIDCRIAFNRDFSNDSETNHPCPQCGKDMFILSHRFRPPKKGDIKKWETVKYLINNGFFYQHILDNNCYTTYPENLQDAKEFVQKYKDQALKINSKAT